MFKLIFVEKKWKEICEYINSTKLNAADKKWITEKKSLCLVKVLCAFPLVRFLYIKLKGNQMK